MTFDPQFAMPPELAIAEEPFELDELDTALDMLAARASLTDPKVEPLPGEEEGALPAADRRVTGFEIHDAGLAEWAMRHVADIDANEDALALQRDEWVQRIEQWHAGMTSRLAARRAFFAGHLEAYAAEYRELDPKHNKTLRLPSGEVTSTDSKPSIKVGDGERVVRWVEQQFVPAERGDLVKITKAPIVAGVKALGHIGQWQAVELGCSHTLEGEQDLGVGEIVACGTCDVDVPVIEVLEEFTAVLDQFGQPIAGAVVDPGGLTFKVKPTR